MDTPSFIQMKYFCDAVRLNGITAAAKQNFVTQSAISQGIKKLESALGCSLLACHPNRFRLTPAGEEAFRYLSNILNQTIAFQKSFLEEHQHVLGNLEFTCMLSFAYTTIPSYLKKFQLTYPTLAVNLQYSDTPDAIKRLVMAGAVDFGILPSFDVKEEDLDRFETRVIYNMQTSLYVSQIIAPEEEKKLKFILAEDLEKAVGFTHIYTQKYRKKPNVFLRVPSWILSARLAAEGLGIAYLPDFVACQPPYNLRLYPSPLKFPSIQAYVIYPRGMKLRKSSEVFLSYFE
ncbi:MAG: LysR family transcriptional regulator [Verrucomicrobiota bacterium]|nr:LysR family transcriptional regulator [Verrucomicrobiota bacterium]